MSRTFDAGSNITLAFSTPVYAKLFENEQALNKSLRTTILAQRDTSDGISKSNVGGWHSHSDLLKWENPDIQTLLGWFTQSVRAINDFSVDSQSQSGEMEASAWANVCLRGHYHQPHFHPDSDWSGVYYIATGTEGSDSPGNAGRIEMLDPRPGIAMMNTPGHPFIGNLQFNPEPGLMLVFPSWLTHHVHPHDGEDERISIALNAKMLSIVDRAPKPRTSFWKR